MAVKGNKRAQKNYMDKFVRVEIRMTAEQREEVQAHAEAQGESTNGFINRAISETMERDKNRWETRTDLLRRFRC